MTPYETLEIKLRDLATKLHGKINVNKVYEMLELTESEIAVFNEVAEKLTDEMVLVRQGNKLGDPASFNFVVGKIDVNKRGYAFVIPEGKASWSESIYINSKDVNGAMTGDKVVVSIKNPKRPTAPGEKKEGVVKRILVKGARSFSGVVRWNPIREELMVWADDDYWYAEGYAGTLEEGLSMICEAVEKGEFPEPGICRIVEVVGNISDPHTGISTILSLYGFVEEFPEDVIKEASMLPQELDEETIQKELEKGRKDIRNLLTVTIDSEDTKDVDDAITIEMLDNGNYMLGVHIADVAHYVREGSAIDKEAYKRGTSVYPVGRVVPMLPKELSNGICSLNKNRDRLALSVMMEVDEMGNVVDHEIFESIINVDYAITYNQLYRIFEKPDYEILKEFGDYLGQLTLMKNLAYILHERRRRRGAIDFNLPETKVELDAEGRPISVSAYRTTFANNIIEEFMLLCNETVAERFYWYNVPFIYRVHDEPEEEKMITLSRIVTNLGYRFKNTSKVHPKSIQSLLDSIKDKPEERIIGTMTLRSMQKAVYRATNDGHFGLALKYYSHFTAPIRRYPDLFIHRIIKQVLHGGLNHKLEEKYSKYAGEYAKHLSDRERAAQEAERDCIDLKICEYMKQFEGKKFTGIISNITSFGMFIELPNTVEGLVRFASLYDYYHFDPETMTAYGELEGREFRIGQKIKDVIVARVDITSKTIEFLLPFG
ncbi:MAG: ribonuclease R [Clostridiaceae bacterium]|nr:ribonuclease R [Clostridiaceae bacterium]